ncbi:hypothetical protein Asera_35150 [Actinocatenispora sera]|uniref:Uncharacterized protein n=1 Tax=Actinocatenispora sera TaxID=390989 RepID=A0A810L2G7_9ACTN|nr:hypothetical protein Asera_35150 [Actinocatenispora sera]
MAVRRLGSSRMPSRSSTGGSAAAAEGAHPGHQLAQVERLRQVVVGAEVEPLDPVGDRTGGRQHQHPGTGVAGHDLPAHFVAGHARQVAVQDDHVVAGDRQVFQRVGTVQNDVDRQPRPAQPRPDRPGQHREVLDDQHPHLAPPSSRRPPPACQAAGVAAVTPG